MIVYNEFVLGYNYCLMIFFIFFISYLFVIFEEYIKIQKSVFMIIASNLIWVIISIFSANNQLNLIKIAINKNLQEFCELFFILFSLIIYVQFLKNRNVFAKVINICFKKNFSNKKIYYILGMISFFLSPIIDNMTTALIMCSLLSFLYKNKNIVGIFSINIVIAANAGGVYSPFGDITTLMIWQNGLLDFLQFFYILIPSLFFYFFVSYILSFFIIDHNKIDIFLFTNVKIKKFGIFMLLFFFFNIFISILLQHILYIPASITMLFGVSILQLIEFFLKKNEIFSLNKLFVKIDWDVLFFFYATMSCINALYIIGYLNICCNYIYEIFDNFIFINYRLTIGGIIIGLISSIIDNIPIVYSIIKVRPHMNIGELLLITFSSGVGGSILSLGSAAGIIAMSQNKIYTFFLHFKYSWIVIIGYFFSISILIHINNDFFYVFY